MREAEFRKKYSRVWRKLEACVHEEDMRHELAPTQRQCCRLLAIARTRHYSRKLQHKLERLTLEAHGMLHGSRSRAFWGAAIRYLFIETPMAFRREWRTVSVAHLVFYGPMLLTLIWVLLQPDAAYQFLGNDTLSQMEEMYDPTAEWHQEHRSAEDDVFMWAFYVFNNVSIGFRTFALGFFAGIGSLLALAFNGYYFGVIGGHLQNSGCGRPFWGFVIAHGAPELTGIVIAGASGLRIGTSLLWPGRRTRLASVKHYAKRALPLIACASMLIFLASFIEAFWSSLPLSTIPFEIKIAVGALCWLLVYGWLLLAGRRWL